MGAIIDKHWGVFSPSTSGTKWPIGRGAPDSLLYTKKDASSLSAEGVS